MKRDDYFESILTIFKSSIILRGSWSIIVNWLMPKIKSLQVKLAQIRERSVPPAF